MNKTDNPYKSLVNLNKRMAQGTALQPTAGIGIVVNPPPNIQIKYNGYTVGSQFLWLDEYWLPGHTRHIKGATSYRGGGSGDASYESHNHPIDNDETWTDTWNVGDRVLMIPVVGEDKSTTKQFIVLGKLKRLDGN